MSTKQQPRGDSDRIAVWEAAATINGVPMIKFASFEFELEDPQEREDMVDGDRIHFDQLENPSGSCAVFPTSPAAPRLYEAVRTKRIGTANFRMPNEDTLGAHSLKGVRFENFSQESLETGGGYQYTADFNADFTN